MDPNHDARSGDRHDSLSIQPQDKQRAVLIGSALTFSDQLLRILNMEFPDLLFRRYASVRDFRGASREPCLIVVDYAAAEQPIELVRKIQADIPGAKVAIAYRTIEQAPALADGERMRAISPPVRLLPMNVSLDALLSLIRLLLCGEEFLPREVIHAWHMNQSRLDLVPSGRKRADVADPNVVLTARELEVLPLIAEGKQNKAIADVLGLSEHTVKLHTHNIFQKLKVRNRTCAADWYRTYSQGLYRDA